MLKEVIKPYGMNGELSKQVLYSTVNNLYSSANKISLKREKILVNIPFCSNMSDVFHLFGIKSIHQQFKSFI
jgi:hypothetical protein